jgi:hypothetical protein
MPCEVFVFHLVELTLMSDVGVPSIDLVLFLGGHTNPLFKYGTTLSADNL